MSLKHEVERFEEACSAIIKALHHDTLALTEQERLDVETNITRVMTAILTAAEQRKRRPTR